MPSTGTFWIYLVDNFIPGAAGKVSEADRRTSSDWVPRNSNCPLLSDELDSLAANVPEIWREEAESIFAGRTIEAESNATAWRSGPAGVLEISYQFSIVLAAYVDAVDNYRGVLAEAFSDYSAGHRSLAEHRISALESRVHTEWNQLSVSRHEWQDATKIGPHRGSGLRPGARRAARESLESSAEAFLLGHELAHHLLGHTAQGSRAQKKKRDKAQAILERIYDSTSLGDLTAGLPPSQTNEIHCDLISFFINAGGIDRTPPFGEIYRAQGGAMIALTSLGHTTGAWGDTPSAESHPGIRRRIRAVEAAVRAACDGRAEQGIEGGHPLGYQAQLQAFARLAEHAYASEHWDEYTQPPRLLDHLASLLESAAEVSAELEVNRGRTQVEKPQT